MDFNFENCLEEGLKNLTSTFCLVLKGLISKLVIE